MHKDAISTDTILWCCHWKAIVGSSQTVSELHAIEELKKRIRFLAFYSKLPTRSNLLFQNSSTKAGKLILGLTEITCSSRECNVHFTSTEWKLNSTQATF